MSTTDSNRNMLFGLLALQVGLIDQSALVAAFQAWTRNRRKSLSEILIERGELETGDQSAVDALVSRHIEKHGGDTERSMALVPVSNSTREQLAASADSDLQQTIIGLGRGVGQPAADPEQTATYSIGTSTAEGQRFRVLRPHARGGLGAVYVAVDEELHREVALKQILEQHADDTSSRQRFLLEAEITGSLEHPGIVPVYGLGTYRDGRPFYAMRFIKGESLKEAIAGFHGDRSLDGNPGARSLALRKLLRRFVDVCNAMEYAHTRGVLHRDLKPGNIIVGRHGETLVVDWGLAKATGKSDPSAGERTLRPASTSGSSDTLPGAALGTPAFMSPEQARGDLEHLGPASDVYSLGATLYCLLTGKPSLEGTDVYAMLQAVQQGRIPSARERDGRVDAALDAVCRRAMALEPENRYGSARALAEDIERWMADEPVSAWREPLSRRALRWLTRHRVSVTAAAAAGLVALLGVSGIGLVQARANRALALKNDELSAANQREAEANEELRVANQREQERFDLAMDAIRTFHTGVSEDFLLKADEFQEQRKKLLGSARDFYEKLEAMLGSNTDLRSRRALGNAYFQLAMVIREVGTGEETLRAFQRAADVQRTICSSASAEQSDMESLARSLSKIGSVLEDIGQGQDGLTVMMEASQILKRVFRDTASAESKLLMAQICGDLAYALDRQGERQQALEEITWASEITESVHSAFPDNTSAMRQMLFNARTKGDLLEQMGRAEEAVETYRRGLITGDRVMHLAPDDQHLKSRVGTLNNYLGIHFVFAGRFRDSIEYFSSARKLCADRAKQFPALVKAREDLAIALHNEGEILNRIGRSAEAIERAREARTLRETLVNQDPDNILLQHYLAGSDGNIGDAFAWQGSSADAVAAYEKAIQRYETLIAKDTSIAEYRHWLAFYDSNWADVLMWQKHNSNALEKQLRLLPIREKVVQDDPQIEFELGLAQTHDRLDRLFAAIGQPEKSAEHRTRCFEIRKKLADEHPDHIFCIVDFSMSMARRGWSEHQSGQDAMAVESFRDAIAKLDRSIDSLDWQYALGTYYSLLSDIARLSSSGMTPEQAESAAKKAVEILKKAAESGYRPLARYQTDPDLDPLREREDFRQLLQWLESAVASGSATESGGSPHP